MTLHVTTFFSCTPLTDTALANSLSWTLLELCRHPDIQSKLRREIRSMAQVIQDRGDKVFSAADFEKMTFLTAVVKVVTSSSTLR